MQFKLAAFTTVAVATLAAATAIDIPTRRNGGGDSGHSNQCNTGPMQCCNSVGTADSAPIAALLGLLGIDVGTVTGLVGVTCSPITVIGTGGTSCSSQPVCCTNNSFNGVVAIGCTTIIVNL